MKQNSKIISPKISVVTVVFNGEKYLEETITSVINQTYDNVEYIIIDGGSTDRTIDIIKRYEEKIDYWVSEKDNGIYDAMNKGIEYSTGYYINFLNAGDTYFDKNTILNISKLHKYDVVYGNTLYVTPHGKYKRAAHKILNYKNLKKGMKVCHQSIFYRKSLFNDFGLFNLNLKYVADYEHLIRIAKNNVKFYNTNIIHDLYIEEGFNSNHWLKSNIEVFKVLQKYYSNIYALFFFVKKIIKKIFSFTIPNMIKVKLKILILGN